MIDMVKDIFKLLLKTVCAFAFWSADLLNFYEIGYKWHLIDGTEKHKYIFV